MEVDQIQQMLVSGFSGVFKVFGEYADGLTAAFALLLGYRLMKVGIERSSTANGALVMPAYLARVVPGAAIALVGAVFMLNRSPLTLLLYLWTVTVLVGFGLAVLGYRLFAAGAMGDSEVEAGWNYRRLVFRGAAPAVFALPGLVMIVLAIWQGPSIVRDYQAASLHSGSAGDNRRQRSDGWIEGGRGGDAHPSRLSGADVRRPHIDRNASLPIGESAAYDRRFQRAGCCRPCTANTTITFSATRK